MLSDVKKQNVMRIWSYETLPTEKPVAGIFNMPSTFQFSWEMLFFEREIKNFLKLLEISCLQVRNSKLIIIIMLHILHSYMLVCVTTIVEVSFKIFFGVAVVLCWSLYPKKLLESLNFNFYLCKLGDLPGGGVEDHRMMFTGHLHLLQSYIQGIFYIC